MQTPLSEPLKGDVTVRLTTHRPSPAYRIEPSSDTTHAAERGSKLINHSAPIAVQKQRDDGGFDAVGTPPTAAAPAFQPGDQIQPARLIEQPAAPTAIPAVAAPLPRFDPAAHAASVEAQPLPVAPVRKTRVVFSSDKIGRIGTSCVHAVVNDMLVSLGFEADGDYTEPPANGLAEPITLTLLGKSYKVAHMGLTFQAGNVMWVVLPIVE